MALLRETTMSVYEKVRLPGGWRTENVGGRGETGDDGLEFAEVKYRLVQLQSQEKHELNCNHKWKCWKKDEVY